MSRFIIALNRASARAQAKIIREFAALFGQSARWFGMHALTHHHFHTSRSLDPKVDGWFRSNQGGDYTTGDYARVDFGWAGTNRKRAWHYMQTKRAASREREFWKKRKREDRDQREFPEGFDVTKPLTDWLGRPRPPGGLLYRGL